MELSYKHLMDPFWEVKVGGGGFRAGEHVPFNSTFDIQRGEQPGRQSQRAPGPEAAGEGEGGKQPSIPPP